MSERILINPGEPGDEKFKNVVNYHLQDSVSHPDPVSRRKMCRVGMYAASQSPVLRYPKGPSTSTIRTLPFHIENYYSGFGQVLLICGLGPLGIPSCCSLWVQMHPFWGFWCQSQTFNGLSN